MKKFSQNKVYFYLSIVVTIIAILAIILGTIYGVKKKNNRISDDIEITFHSKTGKEIAKKKFKLNEKINVSFTDVELELAKNEEFLGWTNNLSGNAIFDLKASLKNRNLYPVYRLKSPQTTKYEIKRYFEKVDESGFTTENETVLGAEPDKEVQLSQDKIIAPKGFELDQTKSETKKTISPDGTTVFNLYFKRKTYKVTFEFDGGMLAGETKKEVTYKFEQNLQDIKKPTKTDPSGLKKYSFQGWLNQATNELIDFAQNNPVESNMHLVAKWEEIDNTKKVYLNLIYESLNNSFDSENEIELQTKKIGTLVSANDQDIKEAIADFLSRNPHPHHETNFDQAKSIASLQVEANSEKQTIKLYFKAKTYTISFNLSEDDLDQNTIDPVLKQALTLKYTNKLSPEIYTKLINIKKLSTETKDFVFEKLIVEETGADFIPDHEYNINITIKPIFQTKDVFVSITPRVQSTDLDKTDAPAWPTQTAKVGEIFNFRPTTNLKYGYKLVGWTDVEGGPVKDIFVTRQTREVFAFLRAERADYQVVHYLEKQGESSALDGQYNEIIENKTDQLVKDRANYTPYTGPDKDLYEFDETKPKKLVDDLAPYTTDTKVFRYYRLKTTRVNFVADSGVKTISPTSTETKRTRQITLPNCQVKDTHNLLGWSKTQNGAIQTKFIATGETLTIYAVTDYQDREITYTIRKEKTDGNFEETQEKKTGKIASTHTVSYRNPDSSVYKEVVYSVSQLTVNADKTKNEVIVTIYRKTYLITFKARNLATTLTGLYAKHGGVIGKITYHLIEEAGYIYRELLLDGKEKTKEEIEKTVVTKEHTVIIYFGKPGGNKIGKYPQTKVENPAGIKPFENKDYNLKFNSKDKDYTVKITRSYYKDSQGLIYEKYNGQYFQLEPVWVVKIPEKNTWFTENIIDYSPFNIYHWQYVNNAIPERSIFKAMIEHIGEVLGRNVYMPTYDDGNFSVKAALDKGNQEQLKKEPTDFAKAVLFNNNYQRGDHYRGINFIPYAESESNLFFYQNNHDFWLATQNDNSRPRVWCIKNGEPSWRLIDAILGVVVCV